MAASSKRALATPAAAIACRLLAVLAMVCAGVHVALTCTAGSDLLPMTATMSVLSLACLACVPRLMTEAVDVGTLLTVACISGLMILSHLWFDHLPDPIGIPMPTLRPNVDLAVHAGIGLAIAQLQLAGFAVASGQLTSPSSRTASETAPNAPCGGAPAWSPIAGGPARRT
jgi:hypothetical protein